MPIYVERTSVINADSFVNHEVATMDGGRTVGTVANAYEAGSLRVFRDQSSLQGGSGKDFTETTSTTFTLASAADADEEIWVCYIKQ